VCLVYRTFLLGELCLVSAIDPVSVLAWRLQVFVFLVVASVIVSGQVVEENYPYFLGFAHLASGLSNGLSGLAAGICIGIVGDAGVRATGQNVRLRPKRSMLDDSFPCAVWIPSRRVLVCARCLPWQMVLSI